MRSRLAIAAALVLAACEGASGPGRAVPPPAGERPVETTVSFEGRVDPAGEALELRTAGPGDAASLAVAPVEAGASGVTLRTSNVSRAGTTCGDHTFEGDVTITNHGAVTLRNVYAEILSMSLPGRESCSSDAAPRPGSAAVSDSNGLWAYGDVPAGGAVTRRWQLRTPTSVGYTFRGRVVTVAEPSSRGAGQGMGATIDRVLLDSDGASLFVTVAFRAPPAGHLLFLLVDDLDRTSGMSGPAALAYDPTGAVGPLSTVAHPLENAAGADVDAFLVAGFSGGTLTPLHARTILGPAASAAAPGLAATQDVPAGRYHLALPYGALGASPGDQVKVWVLYGESNETGLGIHSAAPVPPASQVDRMDSPSGHGLTRLAPAPPAHTLAGTPAGCPAPLQFAVIGDYGYSGPEEAAVATLVRGWRPDLVITVGDNDYDFGFDETTPADFTTDENVGRYYAPFIGAYRGAFGPGAAANAFFPSLGNHDWESRGTTDARAYLDYFTLPGNERYYDFVAGEVHFFVLDSDDREPDGNWETSAQAGWLEAALGASAARWKVVYFHHAPYSSGEFPTEIMRWPFEEWGASAVIGGHNHNYERLQIGGIPYFVNGLGGDGIFPFVQTDPNSRVRFDARHGAQRVVADGRQLRFEFVADDGGLVDTWRIAAPVPCAP